ncbi:MAG: hypothetical protein WC545_03250 [Patescibacteria group bacterium]
MKIFKKEQAGLASLPTVLVLIALIISVGVFVSAVSVSDNLSVSGAGASDRALNYARSGARDALERIARNKDYVGDYDIAAVPDGCLEPFSGCVSVSVAAGNPKMISAAGRAGDFIRKIQVAATLDADGLILDYDWTEQ